MSKRTLAKPLVWTPEVIQATKQAAVAMAGFWDALRQFEEANGVDFKDTADMIGVMAAEYDNPPSVNDLSNESVIDFLNELPIDWVRPGAGTGIGV
jgi:hypothetical protein